MLNATDLVTRLYLTGQEANKAALLFYGNCLMGPVTDEIVTSMSEIMEELNARYLNALKDAEAAMTSDLTIDNALLWTALYLENHQDDLYNE